MKKGKLPPGLAAHQFQKGDAKGIGTKGGQAPSTTVGMSGNMQPPPMNPMNAGSHAARESGLAAAMVARHKKLMG